MGDIIFQDGFQAILVQLEQAGLELRNESFSTALTQYMETMSKKLHRKLGVQKASSYIMDYFPENEKLLHLPLYKTLGQNLMSTLCFFRLKIV